MNKQKIKAIIVLIALPCITYILFRALQPERFGTPSSLLSLFSQCLLPSITGCGFYFICEMGLIDFSVGSNIVLSSIMGVILSQRFGIAGLIIGCFLTGTLVGIVNGVAYKRLRIPSVIITVGLMVVYESLGTIIGKRILTLDSSMRIFQKMPWNFLACLVAFVIAYILVDYTKLGVYARAVGANERAVQTMGIDAMKYKVCAFAACGFFAGFASFMTISYSSSIAPVLNMSSMDRNFQPLMGCFIGIALKKYINPVISIIVGEFTIAMLTTGLITNGIDATLQNVFIGVILLVIVGISASRKKYTVVK